MTGQVINLVYLLQARPLSGYVPKEGRMREGKKRECLCPFSWSVPVHHDFSDGGYWLCPSKILGPGNSTTLSLL
jgi:hypothetical protein